MGKVKGIFASNITGRVGNVVFRKNGSQNIVSQRPASVKNPRSDMQQRQRAFIKTVAAAYSVFRPICDHSFEGVPYGGRSMNYFNKINYPIVSSAEKAVLKNSNDVVVPVQFVISKGSIMWNLQLKSSGVFASIAEYMTQKNITSIANVTFGQLLEALQIKNGDQITIINVANTSRSYINPSFESMQQNASAIYFARYILESTDLDEKAFVKNAGETSTTYSLNASILAEASEFNMNAVLVADAQGNLKINNVQGKAAIWYTAIISRKNADKWLRSSAELFVENKDELQEYEMEYVLPSYKPSDEPYLNNADK